MSETESPPAEGAGAEGEAPAKSGPKGIVLIGALVGSLLAGAAGGLFAVGPVAAKKYELPDSLKHVVAVDESHGEAAAAGDHGEAGGEGGGDATTRILLIDNLVLNPAGSGGTRFLMFAAAIEFKEASSVEMMKTRDAEARDMLLRVLGTQSIDELSSPTLRDGMRQTIVDSLTKFFPAKSRKGAIKRVYFPQFVIQ